MRHIPRCYYNKSLLQIIDRHIEDGYKSYSSLDEIDRETITAQCIEILGDDAYSCIIDSENFHQTLSHFTKFLRTAKSEHSYDLVQSMIKNARDYFSDDMDALFSERCDELYSEKMRDNGFIPLVDRINGEIAWRKSA